MSVARFYDGESTEWTQCRVAAKVRNLAVPSCCTQDIRGDCSAGGTTALGPCDVREAADKALDAVGHLAEPMVTYDAGLVQRIASECAVGPVVVLVNTPAFPLGHYYVLCGVGAGMSLFEVVDPADQIERISLSALGATAREVCFTV